MSELRGRTALVTGGAVRLGRAIVLELARAGADVVIHYHSSDNEAEQVRREVEALGSTAITVKRDITARGAVGELFGEAESRLRTPDILVSNAGIFQRKPFAEITEDELRRMMEVDFIGPFLCAQEAARRMRVGGQGDIVHLLDIGGSSLAWKGYAHYCAAKAALTMLTRVLAVELAPEIRVNGVAPGAVLFPNTEDQEQRQRVLARVPMQREGSAEDIARTVRFLVGGPRYITGQIIAVDGGRVAAG